MFSSKAINLELRDVPADFVPRWNFLYAIIHTIYTPAEGGEGDEQYTVGECDWNLFDRILIDYDYIFVGAGSTKELDWVSPPNKMFLLKRIQKIFCSIAK